MNQLELCVHLITSSPELSQRLFGLNKPTFSNTTTAAATTTTTTVAATNTNKSLISLQAQNSTTSTTASLEFNEGLTTQHLPTVLGLKVKTNLQNITPQQANKQSQQQQQQTSTVPMSTNPNSLLKQQLRAGLRELIDVTVTNASTTTNTLSQQTASSTNAYQLEAQEAACSALQSLANVAERQAQNNIQPPTANNLHHQFLLHMAANPILKSSGEFFQQQQNAMLLREDENNLDLLMDHSDKSDPEMLTLADENAGLDYSTGNETGNAQPENSDQFEVSNNSNSNTIGTNSTTGTRAKSSSSKPVQRRRIRRKAQSSVDDQAEQLTEMSVRGLDLFRYASINEGIYQCTECAKENMQKTFKNKYSFQRHAFLYHEGKHRKVFPCLLCGKEFSRPDKMKNHMKMTHESLVSKEIQNFNPLNYLITAAGEAQSSFPPTSVTQTQAQAQTQNNANTPLLNQLQANNPALSIMINTGDNNKEEGLNLTQQQQENSNDNIHKPLTFPTDIEIKNEIVISPSPSPPPSSLPQSTKVSTSKIVKNSTAIHLTETLSLLKTSVQTTTTAAAAATAQINAQRVGEVK